MARAAAFDYLHNMRFHVSVINSNGGTVDITTAAAGMQEPQAGFSACTMPETTLEMVEYKEGLFLYPRKYPGNTTFNDVTMSRGVARNDSAFYNWIRTVIEGNGEYRVELNIEHFHRIDVLPGPSNPPKDVLNIGGPMFALPSRTCRLYNALPIRHKFGSDMDATDSGVSIMELDVAYEHCAMLDEKGDPVTSAQMNG